MSLSGSFGPLCRTVCVAVALVGASAAGASSGRAGGASLVRPVGAGGATVVGTTRAPVQLDAHGWTARLEVERVLAGEEIEPAAVLRIGWEELVRGRPPRIAAGERVLVALEPLPAKSLWHRRFPDGDALVIADAGSALLHAPDATSLALLERYLAFGDEPEPAQETAALAALVARAKPPLAAGALARLDEIPGLTLQLDATSARTLAGALADPTRPPALRADLLELAGRRGLEALRPEVVALTSAGSGFEPRAWAARIALDGGLEPEQVTLLLGQPDPALRRLAVRHARGTSAERQVRQRIRGDADPVVRAEAVEAWLAWNGEGALGDVEPALFDPDPRVRGRAAIAVGRLGDAAVPRLRELVRSRPAGEALGPIAALRFAGHDGLAALREIAANDPDEQKRELARIGLGATRRH